MANIPLHRGASLMNRSISSAWKSNRYRTHRLRILPSLKHIAYRERYCYWNSSGYLIRQKIYAEQVQLLYAQAPLGTVTSLLIAPLLVWVMWPLIPHVILLIWLVLLESTILARLVLIASFRYRSHLDTDISPWAGRYTWACAATGVVWGGSVVLLIFSPSVVYDTFIALILGGVLMGGVLTMTPVLATYTAYAIPLTLPPMIWFLMQHDSLRITMGATGILYLLLALGTAYRYHKMLVCSLRLAQENLDLACSFSDSKEQVEESNRRLAEKQTALEDSVAAMRELYRVISISYRRPSEQIQAMLKMGCQRFGLGIGILSRVVESRYEVIQVRSPDHQIARGDVFDLKETYCFETLSSQAAQGFECAAVCGWCRHPGYHKLKLKAYLGVPVRVNGEVYGTLSFSDFRPRSTTFSTVDFELLQLMAEWVSGALEQECMALAVQQQQSLLAHASRLSILGEMASGLVHEINQPITAINLYSEACLEQLRGSLNEVGAISELIEKIAAQSTRAGNIIQHIRHFSRYGKAQYIVSRVDELLAEIIDLLELETSRHDIYLHYECAANLPMVRVDRLQVQQVICNLLRNAMDAMKGRKDARDIFISAQLASDDAVIEIAVRDHGSGLKAVNLDQILRPFFTTKSEGLGLGLPISQSIIEAHGGRLWATANEGDCGATFHFTLPVVALHGCWASDRKAVRKPSSQAMVARQSWLI